MNNKDQYILEHIVQYCDEIDATLRYFGCSEERFMESFVFRNAVSMPIMQIGELATRLSDDLIAESPSIPWKAIKGMRTFFAHQYGSMNLQLVWRTALTRIPELKASCEALLSSPQK